MVIPQQAYLFSSIPLIASEATNRSDEKHQAVMQEEK